MENDSGVGCIERRPQSRWPNRINSVSIGRREFFSVAPSRNSMTIND